MTLPDDSVMSLLLAVVTGEPIAPADGVLTVTLPARDGSAHVVTNVDAQLDALEARGWVVIGDDRPEATEQGLYSLELWIRRKFKLKVVARSLQMTPARKGKVTA